MLTQKQQTETAEDLAYQAAVTDDVAIFVEDTVEDPSVAMALTHSSVAVAMLSPAQNKYKNNTNDNNNYDDLNAINTINVSSSKSDDADADEDEINIINTFANNDDSGLVSNDGDAVVSNSTENYNQNKNKNKNKSDSTPDHQILSAARHNDNNHNDENVNNNNNNNNTNNNNTAGNNNHNNNGPFALAFETPPTFRGTSLLSQMNNCNNNKSEENTTTSENVQQQSSSSAVNQFHHTSTTPRRFTYPQHENNSTNSTVNNNINNNNNSTKQGVVVNPFERLATLRKFATDRTNQQQQPSATLHNINNNSLTPGKQQQQQQQQQHLHGTPTSKLQNLLGTPGKYHHLKQQQQQHSVLSGSSSSTLNLSPQTLPKNSSPSSKTHTTTTITTTKPLTTVVDAATSPPPFNLSATNDDNDHDQLNLKNQQLEEEVQSLRKEMNRLQTMFDHQKTLAEESENQRQEFDDKLQAKFMEAVGLSSRLEESKRFCRQLKKESAEARLRTMNMANKTLLGPMSMNNNNNNNSLDHLDEATIDKLLEPRVKAAVRNIEMRYLAVIRDQQDRIQALDELLSSDEPITKVAEASLLRNRKLVEEITATQQVAANSQERHAAAVRDFESKQRDQQTLVDQLQDQFKSSQRALSNERDYVDELLNAVDLLRQEVDAYKERDELEELNEQLISSRD